MIVLGVVTICAVTLGYVLWPVRRRAADRLPALPLEQLEPPSRED